MGLKKIQILLLAGLSLAGLALTACNDDDGSTTTRVDALESEFNIQLARTSAPAGMVNFHITNMGTEMHEFVVIKTDLAAESLPTNADGSYMEDGPGTEVIDEVEDIAPGTVADLTVDLDAGNYVIICNRVEMEEDGTVE